MTVVRFSLVSALLVQVSLGCQQTPTEPASPRCAQVSWITDTKTIDVTDANRQGVAVTFVLAQHNSKWEGDLDCFFKHEYDRQIWVTATIRNRTNSTVSFDYTIATDPSHPLYSGAVTRLAPGETVAVGVCSPVMVCGSFMSESVSVATGPITYAS